MFVDEAVIVCVAGRGGKGCQSLDRSHPGHFRPTGGDGGDGGSVIIEARPNIQTLLDFQLNRYFTAQNGGNGSSNPNRAGAWLTDRTMSVEMMRSGSQCPPPDRGRVELAPHESTRESLHVCKIRRNASRRSDRDDGWPRLAP